MSIWFHCLLVLSTPLFDLVSLAPDAYAKVVVGDTYVLELHNGDQLQTLQIPFEGPLATSRLLPDGKTKTYPVSRLVGKEGAFLYFVGDTRTLTRFDQTTQQFTRIPHRFINLIHSVHAVGDRLLLASPMVTGMDPNQPCGVGFFAWVGADGITQCFGQAKPFMDAFSQGDTPTSYYLPSEQAAYIYYRKSGDLYRFDSAGLLSKRKVDCKAVSAIQGKPAPESVFGLDPETVLLKKTPDSVTVFLLKQDMWVQVGSIPGQVETGIVTKNHVVLMNQKGELTTHPWRGE